MAILKNGEAVGHLVPQEAVEQAGEQEVATMEEVLESLRRRRDVNRPVLDCLKDKMRLLTAELVEAIQDEVSNAGELAGRVRVT